MAGNRGLGTLTLSLIAQIGGFTSGLDKAGRALDSKSRAWEKQLNKMGKAFGASLAAGAGLAAAGIGIYIKNTMEAEKVQAQLAARIKDTGAAAGRTLEQLNAQADSLQGLTIFDDEAIGEAQAALLTFTQVTGETFDRTIEAATDLATVMGTDVADAAKVLGKALSDPEKGLGALRKAGVVLTEDQVKLVKQLQDTGRIAEAQGVILTALAGKMGTAAEASRDTLGGALQALQNSFENLLEGDANDNGMRGARDAVEEFNNQLNDPNLKAGVDDIVEGIFKIGSVAANTISGLHALGVQIGDLFKSNEDKQTISLLQRQEDIEKRLKRLRHGEQETGVDRALLAASMVGLGPGVAELEGELAGVKGILKQRQELARMAASLPQFPGWIDPPAPGAPKGGGASSAGGGKKGAPDAAAREAAKAQEEMLRDLMDAHNDLNGILEDQARQLGGPSLDAAYEYKAAMVEIQKTEETLGRLGKLDVDAQAQIAQAREQATEEYRKRIEAIEATKSPLQELIEQQQHELDLLGLTGAALQTANDLYGMSAEEIAKYGEAVAANNELLERTREQIDAMDQMRDTASGFFQDLAQNGISALDDLEKHITAMVAKQLGDALAQSLFGAFGTGGGGGLFSQIFGSLFGGGGSSPTNFGIPLLGSGLIPGFASGTSSAPGGLAWVGESGRELVNLPKGSQVIPAADSERIARGTSLVVHQHFTGEVTRKTQGQMAQELRRTVAFANRN